MLCVKMDTEKGKEGKAVSNKEKVIALLDSVPEYKMGYLLAYVQGLTADEEADDAYCERLWQDYQNDPDPDKETEYALEDCKRELA